MRTLSSPAITFFAVRRYVATLSLVLALTTSAACGDSKQASSSSTASTTSRDPTLVQVRPVVSESAAPCKAASSDQVALPSPDDPSKCELLGPVAVDARHITEARLVIPSGTAVVVSVELDSEGSAALNSLLSESFGVGGRLAILVRGRVVSTPQVQSPRGQGLEIAKLTEAEAQDLVRALGGDPTLPTTTAPSADDLVCEQHRPPEVGNLQVSLVTSLPASVVASEISKGGGDPSPWNQLPADHRVVRCIYGELIAPGNSFGPTTVCPNGDVVAVSPPTANQFDYYLDGDGHSTRNSTPSPGFGTFSPCTG